MQALLALTALAVAGAATAAGPIVLPRPSFPAPAAGPGSGTVHLTIVSSKPADPARTVQIKPPPFFQLEQHQVISPTYVYDLRNFARPPRIAPGQGSLVDEQVVWAKQAGGVLYVETAHLTYAKASYGLNGYLNAIDLKTHRLRWRSPALVANAEDFVLLGHTLVSGYGFTAEPDYLYAIDTATGRVEGRVLLPTMAERIVRHGDVLTVDTYDHRLVVRVTGA